MTLAAMTAAVVLATTESNAQWTVTYLHPPGATESYALGTSGTQQVGWAKFGGVWRAICWKGTAASWVDLNPEDATASQAAGTLGTQQVGTVGVGGITRASLWNGTAASWIDLNPATAAYSEAYGTTGTQQVGLARVGGITRASLWSGTAVSWVDLHPPGARESAAVGTYGTQQVGYVNFGPGLAGHASLWNGTAASWEDLNPPGADNSEALGISGSQQVGYAVFDTHFSASLWTGSSALWVDLSPAGSSSSIATATSGLQQVGWANVDGEYRASLWSGTAASWVDLSAFLSYWVDTFATSIWSDGTTTFIAGYGYNDETSRVEALLWTSSAVRSISGTVTLADYFGDNTVPTVTFEIRDVGSADNLDTETLQLSTDGTYSFNTTTGPGTYDIYCKPSHWLKQRIGSLTISSTGAASVNFSCINGDCDGDNEVGIGDYALLAAAYNSAPGDGNWNIDADLNGDDAVDIADYAILASQYGNIGDD